MLYEFQCSRDGTLFYYQSGNPVQYIRDLAAKCPLCSGKAKLTGREYPDAEQARKLVEENQALSAGLLCFSCKVPYASSIRSEACPQAHREHWSHEWVSQRVIDLTDKLARGMAPSEPSPPAINPQFVLQFADGRYHAVRKESGYEVLKRVDEIEQAKTFESAEYATNHKHNEAHLRDLPMQLVEIRRQSVIVGPVPQLRDEE